MNIEITHGNPTPDEEAAIKAAILKLWRDDQAAASRSTGDSAWVLSARAAAARTRAVDVPGDQAWRLSMLFDAGPVSSRRTGRGDSR